MNEKKTNSKGRKNMLQTKQDAVRFTSVYDHSIEKITEEARN